MSLTALKVKETNLRRFYPAGFSVMISINETIKGAE
jgi:hypothetical protein